MNNLLFAFPQNHYTLWSCHIPYVRAQRSPGGLHEQPGPVCGMPAHSEPEPLAQALVCKPKNMHTLGRLCLRSKSLESAGDIKSVYGQGEEKQL